MPREPFVFPFSISPVINLKGETILPFQYDAVGLFSEGVATVEMDGAYGYVSESGQMIIPFGQYTKTGQFSEGVACVSKNMEHGKRGYIDIEGNPVTPFLFDMAFPMTSGNAWVNQNGVWGILKSPPADKQSDWARQEISRANELGLTTHRTNGYYQLNVTRLQFTELVVNLTEKLRQETLMAAQDTVFCDTGDYVARQAVLEGIASGSSISFFPNNAITRQEMATMLNRCLQSAGIDLTIDGSISKPYHYIDASEIAPWAQESMNAMTASGIMGGLDEKRLGPKENATLEQAIAVIYRAWVLAQGSEPAGAVW